MKDPCRTNNDFASLIISDLTNLGVTDFCIGSGSRSAPIAKALKENPSVNFLLHYDERSLGFYALGVAKASLKPVCIVTTSGSAVANLFPAVMEAYMDNIPLIVLSCDRPFEDLDRGINQTCRQENLFGEYVSYSKNFPSAPHSFDSAYITSSIAYLVAICKQTLTPVHLNIPFTEPLITDGTFSRGSSPLIKYLPTNVTLSEESILHIVDLLSSYERGIIVVGGSYCKETARGIVSLAEQIHYPILADPLSSIRELGSSFASVDYYNQVIHHTKKLSVLKPDVIVFLGGQIISKNILMWIKSLTDCEQILVNNKHRPIDPTLKISTVVMSEIGPFISEINKHVKKKNPTLYLSMWKQYSLCVKDTVENFFEEKEKLYEPMAISCLLPLLEKKPFSIFLGSSLPVRYGDNFLFPKKVTAKFYGNRGVSGIDGNISTALGICAKNKAPLVAVIGDCTFLHDVGALALMGQKKIPLIIVVINNNGGGIFDFLPYSNQDGLIDTVISPPTDLDIGKIASSFRIPYWKGEFQGDYGKMIEHLLEEKTGGIIEIPSNRGENVLLHQLLDEQVRVSIEKSNRKDKLSYFSFPKKMETSKRSVAFTDF